MYKLSFTRNSIEFNILDEGGGSCEYDRYWTDLWRDSIEHRRGKPRTLVKLSGKRTGDYNIKEDYAVFVQSNSPAH